MNAVVRLERSGFNEDGLREYTFTTSSKLDLSKDKSYVIDLKEKKPKRSLAQNDMLWGIINKIALELDGNIDDKNVYYQQILRIAGIESQSCIGTYSAEDFEKVKGWKDVSAWEILDKRVVNHKMYYSVQLFKGSSNFDSAEMSRLIDVALDYAAKIGIETDYWRSLLNV